MSIERELESLAVTAPVTVEEGTLLGTGVADGYAVFDSPVGEVIVAFNPTGVSAVDVAEDAAFERFGDRFGRRLLEARPPRGWDTKINRAIDKGTPGSLAVDFRSVTDFQHEVLDVAARIPRGEVRPYGWLAKEIGNPGAVRAVGSTMAKNPVPLIIPCHRVVRTDGHIGAYSLGGPHNKTLLLDVEGTHPDDIEDLARRHVRFYATDTTGIYCYPTCRNARRVTDRHRIELHSVDEAEAGGFRPCKVCRP
ncbi:MAG: methylated-DNA--[protein]-cysteine S-methyltransferase [Acidimicrobiia bacterium]|nr:methylated-DNA--[protein]-cysteine S-methyltransferase [Acidimicrobiia bacterium]NNC75111.1 methylated-DNA--[protein]-cysteine S-methyltransferase [Acidimicrobiia bacterium]